MKVSSTGTTLHNGLVEKIPDRVLRVSFYPFLPVVLQLTVIVTGVSK